MIKCLSWDIRPSLTQPYDLNSRISRSSPIKLFFFLLVHAGQVWICPLSYPNKAKTYPAKLCCDIIQLISVWWSRGKLEQTLICITSMILLAKSSAILSRKSTTLFLNRTQHIILEGKQALKSGLHSSSYQLGDVRYAISELECVISEP